MNGTRAATASFFSELSATSAWAAATEQSIDLALYLPATLVQDALSAAGPVRVGGQTLHPEAKGAYTGELSAAHWLDAGVSSVLVGHSERRSLFGETDAAVAARLAAAVAAGLLPVLCVGEQLEERRAGSAEDRVRGQLEACRVVFDEPAAAPVIVAYEPVWAIGTGETATPEIAQAMHATIRAWLSDVAPAVAQETRLLYGGSVTPDNAAALLAQPDIDGALVGGASLTAVSFGQIAAAAPGGPD